MGKNISEEEINKMLHIIQHLHRNLQNSKYKSPQRLQRQLIITLILKEVLVNTNGFLLPSVFPYYR